MSAFETKTITLNGNFNILLLLHILYLFIQTTGTVTVLFWDLKIACKKFLDSIVRHKYIKFQRLHNFQNIIIVIFQVIQCVFCAFHHLQKPVLVHY